MFSHFTPIYFFQFTLVFLTCFYHGNCNSTVFTDSREDLSINKNQTVIPLPKIVGGVEAEENEFPWRCYITSGRREFVCGCSLIDERWVLTAAHCTPGWRRRRFTIHFGTNFRNNRGRNGQIIRARYVINHPGFQDVISGGNDIAMIRLQLPVKTTSKIFPISLPSNFTSEDFTGETAVTSGWGATRGHGMPTRSLRKAFMKIISNAECSQSFQMHIPDNMICSMKGRSSVCAGDSGGSIDIERNGTPYIIGVSSWTDADCRGSAPSVFARVTRHLEWIQNKIQQ